MRKMIVLALLALALLPGCRKGEEPPPPTVAPVMSTLDTTEEMQSEARNRAIEAQMDSDLYWLARCMQTEAGPNWSDACVMMIGEVVLNRVESKWFPNTVKEVVLQEGQYEPFQGDYVRFTPGERYINLAKRLMDGERIMDDHNVIWQALFPQGDDTFITVYDRDVKSTTYFCRSYLG